jgi:GNAT superfamily N-acetyltransferase
VVTRSHISVRSANAGDIDSLVPLWAELRRSGILSVRQAAVTDDAHVKLQLRRLVEREGGRVFLACVSNRPAGMAVVTVVPLGALSDAPCVQVEYTVVAEAFRRRGVGRALMAAAAGYAEEIGAEQITATVSPLSREANRFYAQLGLTPLAVRRVAPAAALRRRIATIDLSDAQGPVARRRSATAARSGVRAALRRMAVASVAADRAHDA